MNINSYNRRLKRQVDAIKNSLHKEVILQYVNVNLDVDDEGNSLVDNNNYIYNNPDISNLKPVIDKVKTASRNPNYRHHLDSYRDIVRYLDNHPSKDMNCNRFNFIKDILPLPYTNNNVTDNMSPEYIASLLKMEEFKCSITDSNRLTSLLDEISSIRVISQGVYGKTANVTSYKKFPNDNLILKLFIDQNIDFSTKDKYTENINSLYEYYANQEVNDLITYIPNFTYNYGITNSSKDCKMIDKNLSDDDKVVTLSTSKGKSLKRDNVICNLIEKRIILNEFVHDSTTLFKIIESSYNVISNNLTPRDVAIQSVQDILDLYVQLIMSLEFMCFNKRMTHNDLHANNILVKFNNIETETSFPTIKLIDPSDPTLTVPAYRKVKSHYTTHIIDYGMMSYVKHNPKTSKNKFIYNPSSYHFNMFNPAIDVYSLTFSFIAYANPYLTRFSNSKNIDLMKFITNLFFDIMMYQILDYKEYQTNEAYKAYESIIKEQTNKYPVNATLNINNPASRSKYDYVHPFYHDNIVNFVNSYINGDIKSIFNYGGISNYKGEGLHDYPSVVMTDNEMKYLLNYNTEEYITSGIPRSDTIEKMEMFDKVMKHEEYSIFKQFINLNSESSVYYKNVFIVDEDTQLIKDNDKVIAYAKPVIDIESVSRISNLIKILLNTHQEIISDPNVSKYITTLKTYIENYKIFEHDIIDFYNILDFWKDSNNINTDLREEIYKFLDYIYNYFKDVGVTGN